MTYERWKPRKRPRKLSRKSSGTLFSCAPCPVHAHARRMEQQASALEQPVSAPVPVSVSVCPSLGDNGQAEEHPGDLPRR